MNSIQCSQCMYWVHKKCSGVRGRLAEDPDYVCPRCCDQARPIDNRPVTQVDVDGTQLDVESNFCYLGDMLCAGGGCKLAIVTRCTVILLPAHPASFAHKFLFQRVAGCNSIADLSLKIVFWAQKFAFGTH